MIQEPVPNSVEDFAARFDELQIEAAKYGICSLSVVIESSPFNVDESKYITHYGGHSVAIGMAEYARHFLLDLGREV